MATNFPSSLDNSSTLPAESAGTTLSINHVTAHQNLQDAVEAIEAKVGADSSAVTTSHDYKLSEVTSTDKAVGKTATQTLTNKTLTSPVINVGSDATGDIYYRNAGVLTRLPIGTDNHILKVNGTVPNWEAETTTVNGSTTVAGIFEAGTSSEVTAGTATGGTGATLVVTPDALAASTPVFNGSGLTGIISSATATASISGSGISTTQNIDTAVSVSGTAKTIIVNFWLKGLSSGGTSTYSIGTAYFDGTTIRSYFSPLYNTTSTTISATTYSVGNTSPVAGGDASNGGWTMSIQSLTSTGFTFRLTYTQGSTFNGGDYKCTVTAIK